jgi:DNA modification methylase
MINQVFNENCIATINRMIDQLLNCICTSPPYFNLRDYGLEPTYYPEITFRLNEFTSDIVIPEMTCCLGLESNPVHYIAHLVYIFRLLKPKLKDDGTLWINIGDSYATKQKKRTEEQACRKSTLKSGLATQIACKDQQTKVVAGLKHKDLIGIPWMLAFALRADGWYLRQDVIWAKKQAMPESVTDRCTRAHEFIFMFSKKPKYFYDHEAIKTPAKEASLNRWKQDVENQEGSEQFGKTNGKMKAVGGPRNSDKQRGHSRKHAGFNARWDLMTEAEQSALGANRRSVWHLSTSNSTEKHFAQFNAELPELIIKAGCPLNGVVYDPFLGSGTTALTAVNLNRNFIGSEQGKPYFDISERRLNVVFEKLSKDIL